MTQLEHILEVVAGVGVEAFIFAMALLVLYRFIGGRFLIPKREIILPNQRGVVVRDDQIVRVAGPGSCWVRPRQRLVLIDARPKPLQIAGVEVIGSDGGIVRLSLSAEYQVADPAVYYSSSANAADAFFVQVRRVINVAARQQKGSALAASPEDFCRRVLYDLEEPAKRLGLAMVNLDVYEALPLGSLRVPDEHEFEFPDSGMVH